MTGGLKLLYVFELDKHLKHHLLPWRRKLKGEKVSIITAHIHESKGSSLQDVLVTGKALLNPVENPVESESDEEILFETYSETEIESSCSSRSSDDANETGSNLDLPVKIPTSTRSG